MSKRIDMINGFPVMVDDEVSGYNSSSTAIETIGLDNSVIHNLPKKHGRLIDEDELIKQLDRYLGKAAMNDFYKSTIKIAVSDILSEVPTVIEAEDGE